MSKDYKIATAATKPEMGLLPLASMQGQARVRAYGNKKYAEGNYLQATTRDGAVLRYKSATLRHIMAGLLELDPESGLPHIDCAITSLQMLREILEQEGVLDQDPGPGNEPPARAANREQRCPTCWALIGDQATTHQVGCYYE